MPSDENKNTVGKLNWPPEEKRKFKYSITDRELEIESGNYIEIPLIENEKGIESR